MATITARTLSRETSRVLDEVADAREGLVVVRDGIELARLTPISDIEREFRARLRAQGVDPDVPPTPRFDLKVMAAAAPGEKTVSDYLMEDRASYYDED